MPFAVSVKPLAKRDLITSAFFVLNAAFNLEWTALIAFSSALCPGAFGPRSGALSSAANNRIAFISVLLQRSRFDKCRLPQVRRSLDNLRHLVAYGRLAEHP